MYDIIMQRRIHSYNLIFFQLRLRYFVLFLKNALGRTEMNPFWERPNSAESRIHIPRWRIRVGCLFEIPEFGRTAYSGKFGVRSLFPKNKIVT